MRFVHQRELRRPRQAVDFGASSRLAALRSGIGIASSSSTGSLLGLYRLIPSPNDRRKVIVELTEACRQAWMSTFNPQTNEEANVLAALDPAQKKQLDGILRQMLRAIDQPGLLNTPTFVPSRERHHHAAQPIHPRMTAEQAPRAAATTAPTLQPLLASTMTRLLRSAPRVQPGRHDT